MIRTAAITLAVAAISASPEVETFYSYPLNGEPLSVTITEDDITRSPHWPDAAENPPVSARRALCLATQARKAISKDTADWKWELNSLQLKQHHWNKSKWYWLAYFEAYPTRGGLGGKAPDLHVVVLMNGRVLKHEVANEDE